MATITKPPILDETGQAIKNSIDLLTANINRTADNIAYDSNLTIKGKIQAIDLTSGGNIIGDLQIDGQNGTTQAVGNTILRIGNNISQGSDKNSMGQIRIYSSNDKYARIYTQTLTANRDLVIPDQGGTIATRDDFVYTYNLIAGSTVYINHSDMVIVATDRKGLWVEGTSGRTFNTINASDNITVTRETQTKLKVVSNAGGGTRIMVISPDDVTFTNS